MSLIVCSECGKQVSDKADNCPNCGAPVTAKNQKFCKHCGEKIDNECVVCPKCGKQVEEINKNEDKQIIINNSNANSNSVSVSNTMATHNTRQLKNKWIALALCFTGFAHKLYEGKVGMGILYFCTGGLFVIGTIMDFFKLLGKPTYYYA